jgi:hypothetical protein
MEAKHTPGPWEISSIDGRTIGPVAYTHTDPEVRAIEIPQMKAVAVVKERIEETEANARLISAAPEMLAMLIELNEFMRHYNSPDASSIYDEARTWKMALAEILAKASGK